MRIHPENTENRANGETKAKIKKSRVGLHPYTHLAKKPDTINSKPKIIRNTAASATIVKPPITGFIITIKPAIIPSIPTVSYTHLRAHETDSYLVCRLLLEKKKKKT